MDFRVITSPSNPQIKEATAARESGRKKGLSTFIIEGPHLTEMALGAGAEIRSVFFTGGFGSKREGREMLKTLSKTTRDIFEVPPRLLNKIADAETPQGVVAVVTYFPVALDKLQLDVVPLLAVADGIGDPGNLGTLIRTADAAGADGIILLPGTCDPFMPKTIRATAGSIFNVPVVLADRAGLTEWLRQKRIRLAVTSADAPKSVFDTDLDLPVALVFGNEARGVSDSIREEADMLLRIPIHGRAESLNVAASAAICLYEAVRQREIKES